MSTGYDSYGMATSTDDAGDTAVTGDETCTRTWYARNTAVGITSLASRTRTVARPCSVAEADLNLPTSSATRGDVLSDTATVYDNTSATTWSANQTPSKGEATWSGRPTGYPALTTNNERLPTGWQTVGRTTYDDSSTDPGLGRPVTVADAEGHTTTTAYTPAEAGPTTEIKVTNPKNQSVTTDLDPERGNTTKTTGVDHKYSESTYDALGRVTATWLPNRKRILHQTANYVYAYHLDAAHPSWVSTETLKADGTTYNTTYSIYDSLLRPLQTQSPTPNGGRLLTDTRYNSKGLVKDSYADIYDPDNTPNGTYQLAGVRRTQADPDHLRRRGPRDHQRPDRPRRSEMVHHHDLHRRFHRGHRLERWLGVTGHHRRPGPHGRSSGEYAGTSPADTQYGSGVGTPYTSTSYTYNLGRAACHRHRPRRCPVDLHLRPVRAANLRHRPGYGHRRQPRHQHHRIHRPGPSLVDQGCGRQSCDLRLRRTRPPDRNLDRARSCRPHLHHRRADTGQPAHLPHLRQRRSRTARYLHALRGRQRDRRERVHNTRSPRTTRSTGRPATQLTLPSNDPLVTSGAVTATLAFSTAYNIDGTQQFVKTPAAGGLPSEQIQTNYDNVGLPTTMAGTSGYVQGTIYSRSASHTTDPGHSTANGIKHVSVTNFYEDGTGRLQESGSPTRHHPTTSRTSTTPTTTPATSPRSPTRSTSAAPARPTTNASPTTDTSASPKPGPPQPTTAPPPRRPPTSAAQAPTGPRTPTPTADCAPPRSTTRAPAAHSTPTATTQGNRTRSPPSWPRQAAPAHPPSTTYDATGNTTTRPQGTAGPTETLGWNPEGSLDSANVSAGSTSSRRTTSTTPTATHSSAKTPPAKPSCTSTESPKSTTTPAPRPPRGTAHLHLRRHLRRPAHQSTRPAHPLLDSRRPARHQLRRHRQHHPGHHQALHHALRRPPRHAIGTWPDDNGFLGKPQDDTTGLTHIGARAYDPTTGRFISVRPPP